MRKHVLITGGTGGIGRAFVRAFSKAGYLVTFTYHSSEQFADVLMKECGAKGFCVNFEDDSSVDDFYESLCLADTPVNVLINNAGIAHYGLIQDVSLDTYRRLFDVDFRSAFFLTKKIIPSMIASHSGTIINVSSIWGETGASCEVLYSSAKGAMIAFTKALAKELAPSGIAVNCISPGVVDTEMMSRFSLEEKETLMQDIPSGSFTKADEIANLALYLSEHSTTSLTGQVIGMNGGMYC